MDTVDERMLAGNVEVEGEGVGRFTAEDACAYDED